MDEVIFLFALWFIGLFVLLIAAFAALMWIYRIRDRRLQKKMDEELEEEE